MEDTPRNDPFDIDPSTLPPETKKRIAWIDGQEPYHATKLIWAGDPTTPPDPCILVVCRDVGAARAVLPVVEELFQDGIEPVFLTDGPAEREVHGRLRGVIACGSSALDLLGTLPRPRAILAAPSVSERGLEIAVRATFPHVPLVLVEDNYGMANGFLARLREAKLPPPERYCVIDDGSAVDAMRRFGIHTGRVVVTGQPAFDRIGEEDVAGTSATARKRLGLTADEKVVTFIATSRLVDLLRAMVPHLARVHAPFRFVFRRHPKDSVPEAEYRRILAESGLRTLDASGMRIEELGCLSDVILTTWSTDGLFGLIRGKMVGYLRDARYVRAERNIPQPMPPVHCGAAYDIEHLDFLAGALNVMLMPTMPRHDEMRRTAARHYRVDGGNTRRVAEAVKSVL